MDTGEVAVAPAKLAVVAFAGAKRVAHANYALATWKRLESVITRRNSN